MIVFATGTLIPARGRGADVHLQPVSRGSSHSGPNPWVEVIKRLSYNTLKSKTYSWRYFLYNFEWIPYMVLSDRGHDDHEVAAVCGAVQEVWGDSGQVPLGEVARRENVQHVTRLKQEQREKTHVNIRQL